MSSRAPNPYPVLVLYFLLFWLALPGLAVAQDEVLQSDVLTRRVDNGSEALDGLVIDSIIIDNRNVYDTDQDRYDNFLFRTANRLHRVTRSGIIGRELLIQVGEPFSVELAQETARNLRLSYELYDAWIEVGLLANGHLLVKVVTIDQWSLLLRLNIDRVGDETDYRFGAEDRNLLGMNQFLSMDYHVQDSDLDYFQSVFRENRLGGYPYRLRLEYSDEPTDRTREVIISQPFYNLNQQSSFLVGVFDRSGRRDIYQDGKKIAASNYEGDRFTASYTHRWGGYLQKVGVTASHDYIFETTDNGADTTGLVVFPSDSVYHRLTLGMTLDRMKFVRLKRINGFDYTEDFSLGTNVHFNLGRAFQPDFKNHVYDRLGMGVSGGEYFSDNLVRLSYERVFWFREGEDFRRLASLMFRWYNTRFSFMTTAVRFLYQSDWREDGSEGLTLGGSNALRGFDKIHATGSRMAVGNFEGRFFPGLELLTVIFGGVAFVDVGAAWGDGEQVNLHDLETSVGVGLRVSLEKSTKSELLRIDVACGQDNTWQVAVGTGQFF